MAVHRSAAARFAVLMALVLVAVCCLGLGLFALSGVASDLRIAHGWPQESATIQALGEPRSGRRGTLHPAQLHVRLRDGSTHLAWSERDLAFAGRQGWLGPPITPAIGDRVLVHVGPGPAPRLMPAASLTGYGAGLGTLVLLVLGPAALLMYVPRMWRMGREAAREPPTSPPRRASAHQRKGGRRRR